MSNFDHLKLKNEIDVKLWKKILDKKIVTPLDDRFECAKCECLVSFPVNLSCNHNICSTCVTDLCRVNERLLCPKDKIPTYRTEMYIDAKLLEEINCLDSICLYQSLGCEWIGTLGAYMAHVKECKYHEIEFQTVQDLDEDSEVEEKGEGDEALETRSKCEFCHKSITNEYEIEHFKECAEFPVKCPNSCSDVKIPRGILDEHLRRECIHGEIECKYANIGCTFKASRKDVLDHEKEAYSQHFEILCEQTSRQKLEISELTFLLQRQDIIICAHQKQLENISKNSQTKLLWKIKGWEQKMKDAVSGKRPILCSQPFFTSHHQFKLSVSLLPNGDGKVKGDYMSVYVRICKSEYDGLLVWPFSLSLDISLIDQIQDPRAAVNHIYTLHPNPCKKNLPFLGRPTSEANPSFGAQRFISLTTLAKRDYIREDAICIRMSLSKSE